VLLKVTNSLPKIKTKKHYKYYKNQNNVFDVFYNKDLAILEKSQNTVFAYENTIVICIREDIINKVIRDFVLVYKIKPHNINKEHTIQHKIDSIVGGLKSLIKENDKKYDSFAYSQKPFTVCFVKLDSYRLTKSFIRYYEFSPETMKWVSTGINKLDPGCDDCEKAMNDCEGIRYNDVILNRYYEVECYKYAEDDEYYEEYYMKHVARDKEDDEDDEGYEEDYNPPEDYFTFIYDLLTGKMAYKSDSYTRKSDADDPPDSYTLKLDDRSFMLVGTKLHIIPMDQYNGNIFNISIGSATLKHDSQKESYMFGIDKKGKILYIFRNLQFNQVFFMYNSSYLKIWKKDGSSPTFSYEDGNIIYRNYKPEYIFLHQNNFFAILIKDSKENILKALYMYYDLKNDLYKYKILELTKLIGNIKSIREATVIGRILSRNNDHDCIGLIISTNANHVITILYQKDTDQFLTSHVANYDKILSFLKYKKSTAICTIIRNAFINEKVEIKFLPTKNNIFGDKYVPPKLDSDHIIINVKAENKISVFFNKMTDTNNRVEEAITPDTYHNLDSSTQECYFECIEPIIVYSYKHE